MTFVDAALLGLIQGITEFLPVSSSGHLVLAQKILAIHIEGIAFEVFVHFGTLLAIITIFRDDIRELFRSSLKTIMNPRQTVKYYKENIYFRLSVLLLIGTIPVGVIGIQFEDFIEITFSDPKMVALMLILTGIVLVLTRFIQTRRKELFLKQAILIGFAQAFAILPGISRSGTTICAGLFLGISKEESAKFSFLLAMPVIIGATILKIFEVYEAVPSHSEIFIYFLGAGVAYISGYLSIKLLLRFLISGKLHFFSYYCFAVGIIVLIVL